MEKSEIISIILKEYDEKKNIAYSKKTQKTNDAYQKCPKLKETDEKINMLGYQNIKNILADVKNAQKIKEDFQKKLNKLIEKRNELIKEYSIDPTYNKPSYQCEKCEDTGYLPDGKRCPCFEKRITELFYQNSRFGSIIEDADFDKFSLDFYSDIAPKNDISPREIVKDALEYAKYFCEHFDENIKNIYFYGNTGLGKTFLSTAVAKNLMDKGKNVKYARATQIFSMYEEFKFKNYSLKNEIDEFYSCDLLVIDDLGSEFLTKTGVSFLFDLLNFRLISNKKIIINTNLDPASFSENYTVRATSRIYENFRIFRFEGEDIRIRKLMGKK